MEQIKKFLESWQNDPAHVRDALIYYINLFENKDGMVIEFVSRPGVSYSFRGMLTSNKPENLRFMIDVIDDDPDSRWLSVCFYAHTVTDPENLGDIAPGGLFGKDAICFNLDEDSPTMRGYIEKRLMEACVHNEQM